LASFPAAETACCHASDSSAESKSASAIFYSSARTGGLDERDETGLSANVRTTRDETAFHAFDRAHENKNASDFSCAPFSNLDASASVTDYENVPWSAIERARAAAALSRRPHGIV
jgi:hypothetical protein